MRNFLLVLTIVTTGISCGSVSNPDSAVGRLDIKRGMSEAQVDSIGALLRKYPNGTQLSIGIIHDSTAIFYGAIRQKDTLKTIENADKVFEIGSLTKVFTSTLLADLSQNKVLNIDDPIQHYLDFPLKDSLEITLKQLANHTSGMPRVPSGFVWESLWHLDNPYKNYSEEKLRNYLSKDLELQSKPGTKYQYSNIGAGTLGYVLSRASGKSYEKLLQQHIFEPLLMQNSTTIRSKVQKQLVYGLDKRGHRTENWDLSSLKGAGAILSTAADLAKFVAANFDSTNKALELSHRKTFTVSDTMDVGLGWFIITRKSGDRWHWHNGGTGGYRSSLVIDLQARQGVVVLSNISASHKYANHIDHLNKSLLKSISLKNKTMHQ